MSSIAIVGTGIAGMSAAWLLHQQHDITVYEKNATLGGHAHTAMVDYFGTSLPVDTGFIVYNESTYPHLTALFNLLEVETLPAPMSFGVSIHRGALEYCGSSMGQMFAQPSLWLDPFYHKMIIDIMRFNNRALNILSTNAADMTLGQLLDRLKMGDYFRRYYLLPMAGAIWSCPPEQILKYPAKSFVRFLFNHGLMQLHDRPPWRTVKGGSREYVKKLTAPFIQRILPGLPARKIVRKAEGVFIEDALGDTRRFDQVIIATHADEAVNLLADISPEELSTLGAFRYQTNEAILHSDASFMPRRKRAWASWVYLLEKEQEDGKSPVSVTYWMNRLQHIDERYPLFVTLNPAHAPEPEKVFDRFIYHHPVLDQSAMQAQTKLLEMQGHNRTWFSGSYHGYGFHEDALHSSIIVANRLGVRAPWQ